MSARLTGKPGIPEHTQASSVKLEGLTCKLLPKQWPPGGWPTGPPKVVARKVDNGGKGHINQFQILNKFSYKSQIVYFFAKKSPMRAVPMSYIYRSIDVLTSRMQSLKHELDDIDRFSFQGAVHCLY